MNRKKKWFALAELAVVLLVTAAALAWGRQAALDQRGYTAYGGECLFIFIPVIYYVLKSMSRKHP